MGMRVLSVLILSAALAFPQQKYSGPRPPKPDVPYLVHATKLVPADVGEAKEANGKKDSSTYVVEGASATAKTPLAEPIFLIATEKLQADSLELYRFDVKNGRRELTLSQKRGRGGPRPLRLSVTRLENGLFRVEAGEFLENGEYSLSPSGSNQVFCFSVY